MATTNLMPLHAGKGRTAERAIRDILGYVKNPQKTEKGQYVTGYECDPRSAGAEFMLAKREYAELTGRVCGKDDVIAYHLRQSFVPGEITPEEANRIGQELARRFTNGKHAFVVATHTDKHHIHNHIIWNSVSLDCSRKFRNFWGSSKALRRLSDTICIENGYSIVDNPKAKGKSYDQWMGDKKPSQRDELRNAIDTALGKKPATFEELIQLLQEAGWEVKRGKTLSLRGAGQKRFKRLDTLGDDYSEETLRAIISGEKKHTPRTSRGRGKSISLLIDIQEKLRQGKGAGYERWAKVFNLKQMAQTMNFLAEHNIQSYDELTVKSDEATARYHELSEQIKSYEKRLSEIKEVRIHIVNYIKTREVYAQYRRSGYSKRFFAEHEQEILLHKAAKKAFDELGVKKLPTVKQLQGEYEDVLEQKRSAYQGYRDVRNVMREFHLARKNVEILIGEKVGKADKSARRRMREDWTGVKECDVLQQEGILQ